MKYVFEKKKAQKKSVSKWAYVVELFQLSLPRLLSISQCQAVNYYSEVWFTKSWLFLLASVIYM